MRYEHDSIRIIVADDSPEMRDIYRSMLATQSYVEIVGMASDGQEALTLAEHVRPEVAVLDIQMPKMNGINVARILETTRPEIGIVIVSSFDDIQYILELFKSRPAGKAYLIKGSISSVDDLVRAVEAVAAGWTVLDKQIVKKLADYYERRVSSFLEPLNSREKHMLFLIASGYTNQAISDLLDAVANEIDDEIKVIYDKLKLPATESHDKRVEVVLALVTQY